MRRPLRWLMIATWVYPLLPVGALYLTWAVAWAALGHTPRPSLDDPKFIGRAVDVPYAAAGLLIGTFPFGAVVGVIGGSLLTATWIDFRGAGRSRCIWLILALVGIYAVPWVLLNWDPLHALEWYLD
jgi:hypothetical protein